VADPSGQFDLMPDTSPLCDFDFGASDLTPAPVAPFSLNRAELISRRGAKDPELDSLKVSPRPLRIRRLGSMQPGFSGGTETDRPVVGAPHGGPP
jgi:hypothetical protein